MDEEGVFWHKCIVSDCSRTVEFDDEPWCFEHSPDSGSSLRGYSARRAAENAPVEHKNVFDKED